MNKVPRIVAEPDDPVNLYLLAIKQNYRRSSAGHCLSPCQEIVEFPKSSLLHTSTMDEHSSLSRTRSRSLSPSAASQQMSREMSELPGEVGLTRIHQTFSRSRSSSPSTCSESSIEDCSDQIAALDALIVELQETKRDIELEEEAVRHTTDAAEDVTDQETSVSSKLATKNESLTDAVEPQSQRQKSPVKHVTSLDSVLFDKKKRIVEMEEKEKILNECKNQIKTLTAANKSLEKNVMELTDELALARSYRIPVRTDLKCWPRTRACVQDLDKKLSLDDNYVDPSEIIAVLLESEKRYVTVLTLLNSHYMQPMRMLASFKPDILSMQQLNSIFLNCNELLVIHRGLYENLLQVTSLPETVQVDKLFEILERTFMAFGHYSSYLAGNRQQNVQKELRQLKSKPQFEHLLNHCQQNCEGLCLNKLLSMPSERMDEYSELLTHFLNPRVRALPEDASKRAKDLKRFLSNLRYSLSDDKSEWDHAQEKIKLLNKLATDGPIPMEIFNSDVRLMKQGPLNQVVGKKELPRHCILFNNYICLATTKDTTHIRIMDSGMISLFGAQLHRCVDVEGQAIGSDLQSGLSEDKLAFRLSLLNNEPLYFRAAKPNEWRQWVEVLEKCIQESRELQMELETDILDHRQLYAVDAGPKIAAASIEKLFQQLTSPQFELRPDFLRVFLLTHSCFTTPMDVLTALLNCIKSPEDMSDRLSQVSDSDLVFDMQLEEATGSGSVSASASSYTINTTDSEIGSPGHSPSIIRRSISSAGQGPAISPSPSPSTGMLRNPSIARKAVHSSTSFISTSDSDVSPHTSAIVVDNNSTPTKDGWAESANDSEVEFRKKSGLGTQPLRIVTSDYSTCSSVASGSASDYYTKLYPRSREGVVLQADSDGSDREMEEAEDVTPEDSLCNIGGHTRRKTYRSMSEGSTNIMGVVKETDSKEKLDVGIGHTERMQQGLDEASRMMELSLSLCNNVFEGEETRKDETLTRDSKLDSPECNKRLTAMSSLSSSQPDLSIDDDFPPPVPPRDPSMMTKLDVTQSLGGYLQSSNLVRSGSEHCLMTQSVSLDPGSKFNSGGKNRFPRRGSLNPLLVDKPDITASPKRSDKSIFRSKKSKKKADTFGGRGTPTGSLMASPARSATMMFNHSPSHTSSLSSSVNLGSGSGVSVNLSASFSGGDGNKAKKSKWKLLQNKVGKKFHKTNITEEEEDDMSRGGSRQQRSHSSSSVKKYNVSRNFSVTEEDYRVSGMGDGSGVISPRSRRTSSSQQQVCNGKVLLKIFNILNVWVYEYFEDFENDSEMVRCLKDSLENLIARSSYGNLEYHQAFQLCKIKPDVLRMFDWENPDKLMKGREIDLGKSLPSQCMKAIAEQLTLMEFSIYAAIQRRELLNCNWKKADKEKLAPNVCRLIRRTNDMTSWVSTEILQRKSPSQRATVIEHFIEIANCCFKHNDMHCSLNITIALGSACIRSLRLTWAEVNKKHKHRFEKLKDAMDYSGRCKKMRENLEQLAQDVENKTGNLPSALPYIGAYLDTIYSLEIASKTYNKTGLVNFTKMTKLAELVRAALQYQSVRYSFEPRLEVMAYVTAAKRLSENDLYELSMSVEPSSN